MESAFFCGFNRQLHAVKPLLGQVGGLKARAGGQTKTAKPLVGHFADLANDFVFFDGAVPDPKWHGPISNGRVDKIVGVHRFWGMRLAVRSGRRVGSVEQRRDAFTRRQHTLDRDTSLRDHAGAGG